MKKRVRLINGKTIFSVVIVALLIVVTVVLINMNGKVTYNDDYFKSDDSKIVSTFVSDVEEFSANQIVPVKSYMVYYYSGNKINNVKVFYKFENFEQTEEANKYLDVGSLEWADAKEVNGEYLIVQMNKSEYDELTTEIVRGFGD